MAREIRTGTPRPGPGAKRDAGSPQCRPRRPAMRHFVAFRRWLLVCVFGCVPPWTIGQVVAAAPATPAAATVAEDTADGTAALLVAGRYADALAQARRAVAVRRAAGAIDDRGLVDALNALVPAAVESGAVDEAMTAAQEALALADRHGEPASPAALTAWHNGGLARLAAGQAQAAAADYRAALDGRRALFGDGHPAVCAGWHELGRASLALGRPDEAIALGTQALRCRDAALGPTHRDTLRTRNLVALATQQAGEPQRAVVAFEALLAADRRALGPDHPDTLVVAGNLGQAYAVVGRPREAVRLLADVADANARVLGAVHRNTLLARQNLASTLRDQGELERALQLFRDCTRDYAATLGAGHPETLLARSNAAAVLLALGRIPEALPELEQVHASRVRTQGATHPDVVESLELIAYAYEWLGRNDDALALAERAARLRVEGAGPEHPDALRAQSNLAIQYLKSGRADAALALFDRVADAQARALGADHRETLWTREMRANALGAVGRHAEALDVARDVLSARERALGPMHPDTLTTWTTLNTLLRGAGRLDEALAAAERAVAAFGKRMGAGHPTALDARRRRAETLRALGRDAAALADFEQVIAGIERLRAAGDLARDDRQAQFGDWVGAYRSAALLHARAGRIERAFRLAEQSKARTLQDTLALRAADGAGLPERERVALRLRERALAERDEALQQATTADERLAAEGARNAALRALAATRSALARKYPRYAELATAPPPSTGRDRAALPPDAVFVSYLIADGRLVAFTVDRRSLAFHDLGPATGLAELAGLVRSSLARPPGTPGERIWALPDGSYRAAFAAPDPGARRIADAAELHAALGRRALEPLRGRLAGHRRWLVSPDGALATVPFEALPDGDDVVLARHDVSYAQSLAVLARIADRARRQPAHRWARDLYAIGAADYARPDSAPDASGDGLPAPPAWAPLPGAAREIDAVARLFAPGRRTVVTGREATESQLAATDRSGDLRQHRYLLIAAHGRLDAANPMASAVVLGADAAADGYVTAAEWPGYHLDSELVVLSACETGLGKVVGGEGITGLPFALFAAGNRGTAMTLWQVDDDSSVRLVAGLFGELRRGTSPAAALAAAKRALWRDPATRHPFYWAAMVLYGR